MKERVVVATPDAVELEMPLAGVASRGWACALDALLMAGLLVVIGLVFGAGRLSASDEDRVVLLALLALLVFLVIWGYEVFWELTLRGQTPGKRLVGLRVIREDGLPIGPRESMLRNLVRLVDMMPLPTYLVGVVSVLVDQRGRRLGDLVAGTLVVREGLGDVRSTRSGATWAARAEQGQAQVAVRLPRGTLSARQMATVEQYLERRSTFQPERRLELARSLAAPLRELLDDELACLLETDPEAVLVKLQQLAGACEQTLQRPSASPQGPLF